MFHVTLYIYIIITDCDHLCVFGRGEKVPLAWRSDFRYTIICVYSMRTIWSYVFYTWNRSCGYFLFYLYCCFFHILFIPIAVRSIPEVYRQVQPRVVYASCITIILYFGRILLPNFTDGYSRFCPRCARAHTFEYINEFHTLCGIHCTECVYNKRASLMVVSS